MRIDYWCCEADFGEHMPTCKNYVAPVPTPAAQPEEELGTCNHEYVPPTPAEPVAKEPKEVLSEQSGHFQTVTGTDNVVVRPGYAALQSHFAVAKRVFENIPPTPAAQPTGGLGTKGKSLWPADLTRCQHCQHNLLNPFTAKHTIFCGMLLCPYRPPTITYANPQPVTGAPEEDYNPFEPPETEAQQNRRVARMIRHNVDERMKSSPAGARERAEGKIIARHLKIELKWDGLEGHSPLCDWRSGQPDSACKCGWILYIHRKQLTGADIIERAWAGEGK